MTKEKIQKENEILKKRLREIYKSLHLQFKSEDMSRTIGKCQAIIECIQDIDNISLNIESIQERGEKE